jgi:recombinational DNA repair protein RecT
MNPLKLNEDMVFSIERCENQARLIVYKGSVENVCRKGAFKNIEHFVLSEEERIFKGRLQLHKNIAVIGINVKGKLTGTISAKEFLNCLLEIKHQNLSL